MEKKTVERENVRIMIIVKKRKKKRNGNEKVREELWGNEIFALPYY